MTKKDLQDLVNLKKELLMWEDYQRHLKRKTYHGEKTDKVAVSLAEAEKTISNITEQIQKKIEECIKFIESVEQSDLRQALFYKYVYGKNYVQIAIKLATTEDAIRVKVRRYLKKTALYKLRFSGGTYEGILKRWERLRAVWNM